MIIVSTINPSSYRIYRTMTGCKRCTILAIGKSNALTVRGGCSSVKRGKRTMPSDINKQRELIDEWTGFAKVHLDRGQKRVADAYLECAHSLLAMLEEGCDSCKHREGDCNYPCYDQEYDAPRCKHIAESFYEPRKDQADE